MKKSGKEYLHKIRSEAGKKGGKIGGKKSGPITGKILGTKYGKIAGKIGGKIGGAVPNSVYVRQTGMPYSYQNIDLPIELLDSIKETPYCTFIINKLLPIIVDLEEFKTSLIPEYVELLKDPEFRFVPKKAVSLHSHFLKRIENLVGKRNRAKFITAYLSREFQ